MGCGNWQKYMRSERCQPRVPTSSRNTEKKSVCLGTYLIMCRFCTGTTGYNAVRYGNTGYISLVLYYLSVRSIELQSNDQREQQRYVIDTCNVVVLPASLVRSRLTKIRVKPWLGIRFCGGSCYLTLLDTQLSPDFSYLANTGLFKLDSFVLLDKAL